MSNNDEFGFKNGCFDKKKAYLLFKKLKRFECRKN